MELFVGNLPRQVNAGEIRRILRRALRFRSPRLCQFTLFHSGAGPAGARIRIEPEASGRALIRRLDGKPYRDRPLVVREFVYRAANRERRVLNWRVRAWDEPERRLRERRHYPRPAVAHPPAAPAGGAEVIALRRGGPVRQGG